MVFDFLTLRKMKEKRGEVAQMIGTNDLLGQTRTAGACIVEPRYVNMLLLSQGTGLSIDLQSSGNGPSKAKSKFSINSNELLRTIGDIFFGESKVFCHESRKEVLREVEYNG